MSEQTPQQPESDIEGTSRRRAAAEFVGFLGVSSILGAVAIQAGEFGVAYSVYPGVLATISTVITCSKWNDLIS